jgi:hypothetical protein
MLMWKGQVDQSEGDTWHNRTTYVEGTKSGRHADRENDVAASKIWIGHLSSRM